jgi:hypothetical protein
MQRVHKLLFTPYFFSKAGSLMACVVGNPMSEKKILYARVPCTIFCTNLQLEKQSTSKHKSKISGF